MEEELILVVDEDIELESIQGLTSYPKMLLEHNIYQKFGKTKHYFRVDKANNAPGLQRHIHVFKDKRGGFSYLPLIMMALLMMDQSIIFPKKNKKLFLL